jgi:hypothetical protein
MTTKEASELDRLPDIPTRKEKKEESLQHVYAYFLNPTFTMEYKPSYPQPFTLAQAIGLDVSTITEGGRDISGHEPALMPC